MQIYLTVGLVILVVIGLGLGFISLRIMSFFLAGILIAVITAAVMSWWVDRQKVEDVPG